MIFFSNCGHAKTWLPVMLQLPATMATIFLIFRAFSENGYKSIKGRESKRI